MANFRDILSSSSLELLKMSLKLAMKLVQPVVCQTHKMLLQHFLQYTEIPDPGFVLLKVGRQLFNSLRCFCMGIVYAIDGSISGSVVFHDLYICGLRFKLVSFYEFKYIVFMQ